MKINRISEFIMLYRLKKWINAMYNSIQTYRVIVERETLRYFYKYMLIYSLFRIRLVKNILCYNIIEYWRWNICQKH
jgi:hypothetical protein